MGLAAWPGKGKQRSDRGSQPTSLTLESIVSFGLGKAGGSNHRALELEEIFVTSHLREKNSRLPWAIWYFGAGVANSSSSNWMLTVCQAQSKMLCIHLTHLITPVTL